MNELQTQPEQSAELAALNTIRTATALTRYPIHRLTKRGGVSIQLKATDDGGQLTLQWEVAPNAKFGQPGPLAYKLDTLIINRKVDVAGYPVPLVLKLGSLREICRELGLNEGQATQDVKNALHQNASAYITAKVTFMAKDRSKKLFEFGHSRYSVVFTGEQLPDGAKADAVYIVFNPIYRDLLDKAQTRPLDYDYLKALRTPAAQRLYELLSFQIYGAIEKKRPRAKYLYSEFCTEAPQTRYVQFKRMHRQMKEVHAPHIESGYILEPVEFIETTDWEGRPDWEMLYKPGPKARAEHREATHRSGGARAPVIKTEQTQRQGPGRSRKPQQQELLLSDPEPLSKKAEPEPLDPEIAELVEELVRNELNRATAVLYAKGDPEECRRQLAFIAPMRDEDFTEGRGAYLARAIPEKWGPSKQYKLQLRRQEVERKRREQSQAAEARQSHQEARRAGFLAEAMGWIDRMEKEAPEAFLAFTASVERELQTLLSRFKGERPQESYRQLYASQRKRVELFAEYFTQNPCPSPELRSWIAQHQKELKELADSR